MIHMNRVNAENMRSNIKLNLRNRKIKLSDMAGTNQEYEIIATLAHKGNVSSKGHYYVNYYDHNEQSWYMINDSKLSQISPDVADKNNEESVVIVLKTEGNSCKIQQTSL